MKYQLTYLRILIALSLGFLAFSQSFAQGVHKVINKPIYAKTNAEYLFIGYILTQTDETVIDFELSCFEGSEFMIDKPGDPNAFILQAEGRTYKLKSIKGIEPGKHVFTKMEVITFQMHFEAVPVFAETFSIYTGTPKGDGLFFEDVLLTEAAEALSKADGGYEKFQFILGSYYERLYEFDLSQKYFSMYIENIKKHAGEESAEYFSGLNMLIKLHTNLGNYEEAEKLALTALKNPSNPHVADIIYSLADNYQILGKHKDAIDTYIRYIRSLEASKGLKSADYSTVYNLIKYSFSQLSDDEKKPICVGVALNTAKVESGTAEMRIFLTDIEEYAVSFNEKMDAGDWTKIPAPTSSDEPQLPFIMVNKKLNKQTKSLFVKLKDSRGRESDTYEVKIIR